MRVDRRQFIQAGAVALVGGSACRGGSQSDSHGPGSSSAPADAKSLTANSNSGRLHMTIEGLYVIEEKGSSAVVHLVDASAVGMPAHRAQLLVYASAIDRAKTVKPDAKHVVQQGNDELWIWDLAGMNVTMPAPQSGSADLELDPPSSEDSLDIPSSPAGWHSLARVPDLRALCGATRITRYDAMSSSVSLSHGHLGVLQPGALGSHAVWNFTDPSGKPLLRRALSNIVEYVCPGGTQALSIQVGSQTVTFKPGAVVEAQLQNLPIARVSPCNPCTPNMNHFAALAQVVDKRFVPTITLAAFPAGVGDEAGADYCPGGRA